MPPSRAINPWKWQDAFGFSQAMEVAGGARWLVCSGQTSVDADGNPVHAGTLPGVAALFHPDILIEIEATACGTGPKHQEGSP